MIGNERERRGEEARVLSMYVCIDNKKVTSNEGKAHTYSGECRVMWYTYHCIREHTLENNISYPKPNITYI